MKKIVTILSFFIFTGFAFAQKGKLAGKISDKATGEDIIGATVLIEGTTNGATTDLDGKYFLQVAPGTYNVVVSYVSYKTKKYEGVVIKDGELTSINVSLEESSTELEEVVIQGAIRKETAAGLLIQQKNAVSMSSGVSAELIRKTPDRTTADVIKRVSGASIQEGKFAVIRGLGDRYNYGMINGVPLPSSESDRKAFSLDIVPAQVVDNLVISKTASPDLPGDFAGGIIQITTKEITDENKSWIGISSTWNTITTFKDFYRSPQSSFSDVLGVDAGKRQIPTDVPATKEGFDAASKNNDQSINYDFLTNSTKAFNNNFEPKRNAALPNISFNGGLARRIQLGKNPLGIMTAITYSNSNRYTPTDANIYGNMPGENSPKLLDYATSSNKRGTFYNLNNYENAVNAAGILNFTYKLGLNSKFYFKNLYTIVSKDQTTIRTGNRLQQGINPVDPNFSKDSSIAFYYQSNRMYSAQFGGEHALNVSKIKIDYVLGYINYNKDNPDFKRLSFFAPYQDTTLTTTNNYAINGVGALASPDAPGRFAFKLNEQSYSANLNASLPVSEIRTTFKVGLMATSRNRSFQGRTFSFQWRPQNAFQPTPDSLSFGQALAPVNISKDRFYQTDQTNGSNSYTANANLYAAYGMADWKLLSNLRIIGGLRVESFRQIINSKDGAANTPVKVDTVWTDFLPSVNIVYSLTEKMNLRFAYSKTVSRPEFREFAPLAFYEFNFNSIVVGNNKLTRSRIDNIDFKWEFYPSNGTLFSINPFFKYFRDPIELNRNPGNQGQQQLTYLNAKSAQNFGVELEARTTLEFLNKAAPSRFMKNMTIYGNFTYIFSKVNLEGTTASSIGSRPLQGQSPYVFNAGASYNDEETGWDFTINVNQIGPRIFAIANERRFLIWENSRFVFDASITKTFKNNLQIRAMIGDLLAQPLVFYHDLNGNGVYNDKVDVVAFKNRYGQNLSLSVVYTF